MTIADLRATIASLGIASLIVGCENGVITVVTDGDFREWDGVPVLLNDDPADALQDAAVDLGRVQALDDPQFLHLAVEVGRPVNPQSMRGTIRMLFDADGDVATGTTVSGMTGADLVLEFSRMDVVRDGGYGFGIGLRRVRSAEGALESAYGGHVLSAPTHSTSRMETRIARGATGEFPEFFVGDSLRVKMLFQDSAGVRDETDVASYSFTSSAQSIQNDTARVPEKSAGTFRVLQWNVQGGRLREWGPAFGRIMAGLGPDIILMDEVYATVTADDLREIFAASRLGEMGVWSFVIGKTGGRQKGVIATRLPIRAEDDLLSVWYGQGMVDLAENASDGSVLDSLLALERGRGMATAGAWVTVHGRELLLVPVDFQSSGYQGSAEDRIRELQATTLRNRIAEVLQGGATSLVIAGDLNLVGSVTPLSLLRAGLDSGGRDLEVVDPYRLSDRSQATWRNLRRGPFTPGRLDFALYSSSSLELTGAFVFDAAEVAPEELARLGVELNDSATASYHLPVIIDLRWRS